MGAQTTPAHDTVPPDPPDARAPPEERVAPPAPPLAICVLPAKARAPPLAPPVAAPAAPPRLRPVAPPLEAVGTPPAAKPPAAKPPLPLVAVPAAPPVAFPTVPPVETSGMPPEAFNPVSPQLATSGSLPHAPTTTRPTVKRARLHHMGRLCSKKVRQVEQTRLHRAVRPSYFGGSSRNGPATADHSGAGASLLQPRHLLAGSSSCHPPRPVPADPESTAGLKRRAFASCPLCSIRPISSTESKQRTPPAKY